MASDRGVCYAQVEQQAMHNATGASRHGDTLVLETARAGPVHFVSTTGDPETSTRYLFRERQDVLGFFLVEIMHYESAGFALVSTATGRTTWLTDVPVASPDGSRLLVAAMDLESCEEDTGLWVYRIQADTLGEEFGMDLNGCDAPWGPKAATWPSPSLIQFTRVERSAGGRFVERPATLAFQAGRWRLTIP
jgi:hypothetical protein